jgi:hypothetical protein
VSRERHRAWDHLGRHRAPRAEPARLAAESGAVPLGGVLIYPVRLGQWRFDDIVWLEKRSLYPGGSRGRRRAACVSAAAAGRTRRRPRLEASPEHEGDSEAGGRASHADLTATS